MAITQNELNEIVNAVLSAIRTNAQTIDQLQPVTTLGNNNSFEVSGGRRITYSSLRNVLGVDQKVDKVPGKGLSENDFTEDYRVGLEMLLSDAPSIDQWLTQLEQDVETNAANILAQQAALGKVGGGVMFFDEVDNSENPTVSSVTLAHPAKIVYLSATRRFVGVDANGDFCNNFLGADAYGEVYSGWGRVGIEPKLRTVYVCLADFKAYQLVNGEFSEVDDYSVAFGGHLRRATFDALGVRPLSGDADVTEPPANYSAVEIVYDQLTCRFMKRYAVSTGLLVSYKWMELTEEEAAELGTMRGHGAVPFSNCLYLCNDDGRTYIYTGSPTPKGNAQNPPSFFPVTAARPAAATATSDGLMSAADKVALAAFGDSVEVKEFASVSEAATYAASAEFAQNPRKQLLLFKCGASSQNGGFMVQQRWEGITYQYLFAENKWRVRGVKGTNAYNWEICMPNKLTFAGNVLKILDYCNNVVAQVSGVASTTAATTTAAGLMSTADKVKLNGLPTAATLTTRLNGKVDAEAGKGLSSHDFSSQWLTRLSNAGVYGREANTLRAVNGVFALRADSTDEQIKAALTEYSSRNVLTREDLEYCAGHNCALWDEETQGFVTVTCNGGGYFNLLELSQANYGELPRLRMVGLWAKADGTFAVTRQGQEERLAFRSEFEALEARVAALEGADRG